MSGKPRRPFTNEEVKNLIAGYKSHGKNWAIIREKYSFNNRTNIDLKDKARNLIKKGLLEL